MCDDQSAETDLDAVRLLVVQFIFLVPFATVAADEPKIQNILFDDIPAIEIAD